MFSAVGSENTRLSLSRLYKFGGLLVGHGWNATALLDCHGVLDLYRHSAPEVQGKVLAAIHIDPQQRMALWGFGLAVFFLYAGYRAWSEEYGNNERLVLENAISSLPLFRWTIHESLLSTVVGNDNRVTSIEKARFYVKVTLWNSGPTSVIGEWSVRVDGHSFDSIQVFEDNSDSGPSDPVISGGRSTKEIFFNLAMSPARAFAKSLDDWKVSFADASGNRYEFPPEGLRVRI
jgi:hypothetical protein